MYAASKERPIVLIVEDVDGIRAGMHRLLKGSGYLVCEATDDESAIEVARGVEPDAILTDIELPTLVELIRRVRDDERLRDVPIIAVEDADEPRSAELIVLPNFDHFDELMKSWGGGGDAGER